VAKIRGNTA